LELPRIVVDNGQTGTRHDDEFYLLENGSSNKLICSRHTPAVSAYSTKNYNFWQIEFYPAQEKWVIKREDGTRYVYGDKNSGRNTVQWMVKWGNWIGNSTQPANQQQTGYIWNLSEIENMWGDKMVFEYENTDEYVALDASAITSEQRHTKSSYIKRVTDPFGQSVEFAYQDKLPGEYFDPHIEKTEPDAYQEKYESKYLSSILVKARLGTSLYAVDFQYTVTGSGGLTKRYLTQVQKRFPNNETQPATQFDYFTTGESTGCLKRVVNSLGAHIDYFYETVTIPNSNRQLALTTPIGYGQVRTFFSNNFTVVTWRKLGSGGTVDGSPQPVKIFAYYWDGRWVGEELWQTSGITSSNYDRASVVLEEEHFAYRVFNGFNNAIFIARKKTAFIGNNQWAKLIWAHGTSGDPNVTGTVHAGKDFVAYVSRYLNQVRTAVWKGEQWVEHRVPIPEPSAELFCTAGPNYIFVHNDYYGNFDVLHLLYLDQEKKWNTRTLPSSVGFRTDGDDVRDSYWHAAPSFVVGLPQYNHEYIYSWDEDYTNFSKVDILGFWSDNSLVPIVNNSLFAITELGGAGVSARYDGVNWIKKGPYGFYWYPNISVGEDFFVRDIDSRKKPREIYLSTFDPNTRTWNEDIQYIDHADGRLNGNYGLVIEAGTNSFAIKDGWLYNRTASGSWEYTDKVYLQPPPYATIESLIGGSLFPRTPNFIAYEYSNTKFGDPKGVYVGLIKNDVIQDYKKFPDWQVKQYVLNQLVSLVSPNTIALLSGTSSITLCRVVDEELTGNITTHVAKSLTWSDGNQVFETTFHYQNGRALASGQLAYFNSVVSVPGSKNLSATPYGKTQNYFYNGMPEASLMVRPTASNAGKELLLLGLPYQVDVYDAGGTVVSSSKSSYKVFSKAVNNTVPEVNDSAFYIRAIRSEQKLDGMTVVAETVYDENTGLVRQTRQFNSKGVGQTTEEIATTLKYWWEAYDTDRSENILSPVVQRTELRNGQPVTSSVVRWHFNSSVNKYFPFDTYQWLLSGDTNFTAWNESTTPSADWQRLTKITRIDPADGIVLETQNLDETTEATIYDRFHSRVQAKATYALYDQVAFTSFEDLGLNGNWLYAVILFSNTESQTGRHCFFSQELDPSGPPFNYISKSVGPGVYEVSYWMKAETATVEADNGTVMQTAVLDTQNGWTLTRAFVRFDATGTVKIKVPFNGLVDEVRLKPKEAQMTSYVYDAAGNLISQTDTNLQQVHYTYDGQYRVATVRDHKNRITKSYNYHFRNQ
jgi:YD repeat-containing protein